MATKRTQTKSVKARLAKPEPPTKRCSVTFRVDAPAAHRVDVSGSFNGWDLKPLKKGRQGIWSVNLRPKPGRYEYKFLVDDLWVPDPSNPEKTTDESGNINSVIVLK